MADELDILVLQRLRQIRADMATKAELAEVKGDLKSEINSLRADVASDLAIMRSKTGAEFKQVREQIVGLRRAVIKPPAMRDG